MPLNSPGHWDFFISYIQREAKPEAVALSYELGGTVWLDTKMGLRSVDAMEEGVKGCKTFIAILTDSYFASEFCCLEMRTALKAGCQIITTYTPSVSNIGAILSKLPTEFQVVQSFDAQKIDINDPDFMEASLKKIFRLVQGGGGLEQVTKATAAMKVTAVPAFEQKFIEMMELTSEWKRYTKEDDFPFIELCVQDGKVLYKCYGNEKGECVKPSKIGAFTICWGNSAWGDLKDGKGGATIDIVDNLTIREKGVSKVFKADVSGEQAVAEKLKLTSAWKRFTKEDDFPFIELCVQDGKVLYNCYGYQKAARIEPSKMGAFTIRWGNKTWGDLEDGKGGATIDIVDSMTIREKGVSKVFKA